jgi:hypothetical protein
MILERWIVNMQQKDYYVDIRNRGIRISFFATFAIIVVFALYGYITSPLHIGIISSKTVQSMSTLGLAVLLFLVGSLVVIGYSVYRICLAEKMKIQSAIDVKKGYNSGMLLPIVVDIISQAKRYRLVFISVLIAYALLFAFISQIIIFRPYISFSHIYQVTIPSWIITPCCNLPGLVPTFTAYISDNLIVFVIPINLILTVVLSTLVSVNMTLALYVFQNKRSKKNTKNTSCCFSGIGAATGLFTACPTCAGTFFFTIAATIISAAGAPSSLAAAVVAAPSAAAAAALAPFQLLFIIISIAVLLVSSYLTVNSIKKSYMSKEPIKSDV